MPCDVNRKHRIYRVLSVRLTLTLTLTRATYNTNLPKKRRGLTRLTVRVQNVWHALFQLPIIVCSHFRLCEVASGHFVVTLA